MAFVPNEEVHAYWDMLLTDTIESNDGLQGFAVNYFQKTYIGQRLDNGIEVDARFPYQSWNMFQRIRDGLPRTNNSLEGWHCMMMKDLSCHPSLPTVAKKYLAEQKLKSVQREQHLDGRITGTKRTRQKYRVQTEKYVKLTDRFTAGVLYGLDYLDAVAGATYIPT